MQYADFRTMLYSDTLVPDIFINEYLPALKGDYVKIYIYCLFLVGKNRDPSVEDLARILDVPIETVKKGLRFMSNLNMLSWTDEGVMLKDLKEIEINKFYRPKSTSTPEEAAESGRLNIRRRQVIEAINEKFFSGVMSISWYTDVDLWFSQYGFEEDVMMMLFQHCRDSGALTKNYVAKVAENMHLKGVKNSYDFDRYIKRREEMKSVRKQIQKKLRWRTPLNEFHEIFLDKWIYQFGFSLDIIYCALQRSVNNPDFGFNYYDAILTNWHNNKIDTVEKAQAEMKKFSADYAANKGEGGGRAGGRAGQGWASNRGGFEQREYDEEYLNGFVSSEPASDPEKAPMNDQETKKHE